MKNEKDQSLKVFKNEKLKSGNAGFDKDGNLQKMAKSAFSFHLLIFE